MSRLKPCKDCDNSVSKSAKTCPHCGVRLKDGFFKNVAKLLAYSVLGLVALGLIASIFEESAGTKNGASSTSASSTSTSNESAKALAKVKTDLRTEFDNANNELVDMDLSRLTDGRNTIVAAASIFGDFGKIYERAREAQGYTSEELGVFKARLIRAQETQLPILRDAYGPAMRKKLWEFDLKARTIGAGFRIVEFTGGTFAANRNKKKFQEEINGELSVLRFTHAHYLWYEGSDEYTQYTLNNPTDSEIAKLSTGRDFLYSVDEQ